VEDIIIRRLEWAGHITRMEEEWIPKRVRNRNFHTTRPVGRPRTRWADVVQRDALQLLGIRGWRRRGADRDEWRRLVGEAKARKGLYHHGWIDGYCLSCSKYPLCGKAYDCLAIFQQPNVFNYSFQ
jgi:hypothetical protein